jgi:DNA-binding winged helix-turn-helix (wHTH) protein
MALCEHCRAEIEEAAARLPPPWFDHDQKTIAGERVHPKVWEVLLILWRRRGRYTSRDSIMTLLYSDRVEDPPDEKIVDVYVSKVRRSLAPTPWAIDSVYHHGHQLIDRVRLERREVEIGEVEIGVPAPPPKIKTSGPHGDKYRLEELRVGESRRVYNVRLATLKSACWLARRQGRGEFRAAFDGDGQMRVWRLAAATGRAPPSAAQRAAAAAAVTATGSRARSGS